MPSIATVHEQVHQGTGQDEQVRQNPEDMRVMFPQDIEPGD
jgi:hypothetical protein